MTATNEKLLSKIDALYDTWTHLSKSSSPSELQSFFAFFAPNCTTNLKSMREPADHGRDAALSTLKQSLAVQKIEEVHVKTRIVSEDGLMVIQEMNNAVDILGTKFELPEVVVIKFAEDGLIDQFQIYCCRSPVVRAVQEVTDRGPYSQEEMARGE